MPKTFDVGARIASTADMLASVTDARIWVVIEVPTAACHVFADPSQFDTALIHMAVNAQG